MAERERGKDSDIIFLVLILVVGGTFLGVDHPTIFFGVGDGVGIVGTGSSLVNIVVPMDSLVREEATFFSLRWISSCLMRVLGLMSLPFLDQVSDALLDVIKAAGELEPNRSRYE
jgi:hypothetical protein